MTNDMSKTKNDKSPNAGITPIKPAASAAAINETGIATSPGSNRGGPSWMGRIRANLKTLRDEKGAPTTAIDSVLSFLSTLPEEYGQQARVLDVEVGDIVVVNVGCDARNVLDMLGVKGGEGKVTEVIKGKGECRVEFSGSKGLVTLPIRKGDLSKTPMK